MTSLLAAGLLVAEGGRERGREGKRLCKASDQPVGAGWRMVEEGGTGGVEGGHRRALSLCASTHTWPTGKGRSRARRCARACVYNGGERVRPTLKADGAPRYRTVFNRWTRAADRSREGRRECCDVRIGIGILPSYIFAYLSVEKSMHP